MSLFEQFVWMTHGWRDGTHLMAFMNVAYCDESGDHRPPGVFSVSGYLSHGPTWHKLGWQWTRVLREEGLEASGFHMGECEAGRHPPYSAMSPEDRERLQRRFIGLLNDTRLWGCAVAVRSDEYREIIGKHRPKRGNYAKPYHLLFQHTVERLALVLDAVKDSKGECVAFVFDQHQEFQKEAIKIYESLKRSDLKFVHRLGSLTFDTRFAQVQLQAADVLAYESMRYFREVKLQGLKERWQMKLLRSVRTRAQLETRMFTAAGLRTVLTKMKPRS